MRAFVDRRVRLFSRITDSQIIQYHPNQEQMIKVLLKEGSREQIRRALTDREVKVRLTETIEELCRERDVEAPP